MARLTKPAADLGAQSSGSAPVLPDTDRASVHRVDHPPAPIFLLQAHPERWAIMAGRLVPSLRQMRIEPGVNRVDKAGNYKFALAKTEERGWITIPWDVDGEGTSYIRAHEGIRGTVHATRWTKLYRGSKQVGCDLDGYASWLAGLIGRGVLPPIALRVVERMIEDTQRQVDTMADRVAHTPSLRGPHKRLTDDLAILTAARDSLLGGQSMSSGSAPVEPPAEAAEPAEPPGLTDGKVADVVARVAEVTDPAILEAAAEAAGRKGVQRAISRRLVELDSEPGQA